MLLLVGLLLPWAMHICAWNAVLFGDEQVSFYCEEVDGRKVC